MLITLSWCYINSTNYTNSAANMQNNKVLLNNLFETKLNIRKSFLYKTLRKKPGKFHQLTKKLTHTVRNLNKAQDIQTSFMQFSGEFGA